MSIAEAIFAVIGALSSLAAVTVILTLVLHSAWSSYREKMRARRERRRFVKDATADLAALDDPSALIAALNKSRSEGDAA